MHLKIFLLKISAANLVKNMNKKLVAALSLGAGSIINGFLASEAFGFVGALTSAIANLLAYFAGIIIESDNRNNSDGDDKQ